eukprot:CAMPEP_0176251366 /NCGR_PEP_ID=MMETSP0121_2-20121125/34963_1 /TAXON_ID=160619 /ORGANISM="Kryptoperidinium foliaceum, Strain CCMP 1326" /LENGTH=181 /DNA_ID=CAMNT_0017591109 /DNA_START=37 /DNA_END=579 /DNA_ORIENTATION=+
MAPSVAPVAGLVAGLLVRGASAANTGPRRAFCRDDEQCSLIVVSAVIGTAGLVLLLAVAAVCRFRHKHHGLLTEGEAQDVEVEAKEDQEQGACGGPLASIFGCDDGREEPGQRDQKMECLEAGLGLDTLDIGMPPLGAPEQAKPRSPIMQGAAVRPSPGLFEGCCSMQCSVQRDDKVDSTG